MAKYHGIVWHGEPTDYDRSEELSPDYTSADLQARNEGIMFSLRALWGQIETVSFTTANRSNCPLSSFMADMIYMPPPSLCRNGFQRLKRYRRS
jgi:hypothetical protein